MESIEALRKCTIITGLPRSGTTLVCHLLSSLPDVVALSEPMKVLNFKGLTTQQLHIEINSFVLQNRESLLNRGLASSKQINGKVPDNTISNNIYENGLRQKLAQKGQIVLNKVLSDNFTIIIKHNAAFTAFLDKLIPYYNCFGIIRNPLAILSSWQTVNLPIQQGYIPVGVALDKKLCNALSNINDILDRQLIILNWYFERFKQFLPPERIIKYENVILTSGRCLSCITPGAVLLNKTLESQNSSKLYKREILENIVKRLMNSSGNYWSFYSKDEVQQLHYEMLLDK